MLVSPDYASSPRDCHPNPGWFGAGRKLLIMPSAIWAQMPRGRRFDSSPPLAPCVGRLPHPWAVGAVAFPASSPTRTPAVSTRPCSGMASTQGSLSASRISRSTEARRGPSGRCLLRGAVVNHCDRLLSYLTSFLSPTRFPSVYFCCRFIRHAVKCPFSSANCHHACFMNKIIH